MSLQEIEPVELHRILESGSPVTVLDVRQLEEHLLVALPGSTLIPLMELPERLLELSKLLGDPKIPAVCYCRVGQRSELAVSFLHSQGFLHIRNLRGGINAFAKEIDCGLAPY